LADRDVQVKGGAAGALLHEIIKISRYAALRRTSVTSRSISLLLLMMLLAVVKGRANHKSVFIKFTMLHDRFVDSFLVKTARWQVAGLKLMDIKVDLYLNG
jgi:hypothetical protein